MKPTRFIQNKYRTKIFQFYQYQEKKINHQLKQSSTHHIRHLECYVLSVWFKESGNMHFCVPCGENCGREMLP